MSESYLTEEEVEKLENCAQSTATPQLWKADGQGKPVSISDIVKSKGMAKGKDGKSYRPKRWIPVGLEVLVKKWKPTGKAEDQMSCVCEGRGCDKCA